MAKKRKKVGPVGMLEGAIRDRIRGLNLTPYRVGKMTGVDASVIQRFMADERSLTLDTAEKLAKALDLVLMIKPGSTLAMDLVRDQATKDEAKHRGDE
jgi:plasmid maintenance system antidote protein VapI